jgi:hypothetical protein
VGTIVFRSVGQAERAMRELNAARPKPEIGVQYLSFKYAREQPEPLPKRSNRPAPTGAATRASE